MTLDARLYALALAAVLYAGPAVAGPVCKPEFVIREPAREGMRGIHDARWCGSDALVYMTADKFPTTSDPVMVWVDLATGERRRVASGRVLVSELHGISSVATSFGCVPDGSWVYYTVPDPDYRNRSTEIVAWPVAGGRTTTVTLAAEIWRSYVSPDGRVLVLQEGNVDKDAPPIIVEKPAQPPFRELVRLNRNQWLPVGWLADSRSLRASFWSADRKTKSEFIIDLRKPAPVLTPLVDVTSPADLPASGEGDARTEFFVTDWGYDPAETALRHCTIGGDRRYCENIVTLPHWKNEGASDIVARRGDNMFLYDTIQYVPRSDNSNPFAVYRYDIATGRSFQVSDHTESRLMAGLSPDGKRLVYRSEPFTLNVFNLDDPETRQCGVPVDEARKK